MYLRSKLNFAAIHTSRLHAHHVQPCICQQQSSANLGFQPRLLWSDRQDRSCFACFTVPADAPERNVELGPQVRYKGVSMTSSKRYASKITLQGKNRHLGTYTTPEDAARVHDEACILLKRRPVNFSKSEYDEAAILLCPDLDTFVEGKKATGGLRTKSSRFVGVTLQKPSSWLSNCSVKDRHGSTLVQMGAFTTEELAARAYDKLRLHQGLDTKNFPTASYDLQPILMHETIDSLVASIKAEAKALKSTEYSSRYIGVYKYTSGTHKAFPYEAYLFSIGKQHVHLGYYKTEKQAAMSHDEGCIYQGRNPVNFPDHPYDMHEICTPADLAKFVERSREMAARLVKAQQTSRFTGVSWNWRRNTWEAYVHIRKRKINIGDFENERKAARAVDAQRNSLGQEAVNFPMKSSRTFESGAAWLRSATLPREIAEK
ncbi:hypothetical protein ABBQ38_013041 [Trebouxia sp. C0009 RCD-2024]